MSAIMARMVRTTIMAERELIDELRSIAEHEHVSLAEVIRQGLEWRVSTRRRVPSFVRRHAPGVQSPDDAAARDEELILEWVESRDARRRDASL